MSAAAKPRSKPKMKRDRSKSKKGRSSGKKKRTSSKKKREHTTREVEIEVAAELRHEKYMDEVYPNIWLGTADAVLDSELPSLKRLLITHVVSIGCYQDWWQFRKEPQHLLVPLEDTPFVFITDFFPSVFAFMNEALDQKHAVLVHCQNGKSRSGACVVAYLMHQLKRGYPETLNRVLQHRKRVMPNIGFQIQLRAFAKQKWSLSAKYSDSTDIDKELAGALRNLSAQVLKLQSDVREAETIFVTITKQSAISAERRKKHGGLRGIEQKAAEAPASDWTRAIQIGLDEGDLAAFRKEWVLLVFLCHQFQQYKVAVHKDILNILFILAEMYFGDLLATFEDVFNPKDDSLVLEYSDPSVAVAAAKAAYAGAEETEE